MTPEQVIEDVLQQSLMDTSTVQHYSNIIAERIRREFCITNEHDMQTRLRWDMDVPIGKITYCRRCGAEKQEER